MEPIAQFFHLHTYGNHPVACAAGLKNLEIMQKENLIKNSEEMGKYFLEGLKNLEKHPIVGEARGTGLWLAIDFTSDKKVRTPFPLNRVNNIVARAKQLGVLFKTMGFALEFAPPLIITKEDINQAVAVLDQCISEEEKDMGL
jgi:adenosylmethionine-8-amino-7-oxononanoate aminotransferase